MNMKHKTGGTKQKYTFALRWMYVVRSNMHVDYGQVSELSCCFQVENLNVNQATDVHKA